MSAKKRISHKREKTMLEEFDAVNLGTSNIPYDSSEGAFEVYLPAFLFLYAGSLCMAYTVNYRKIGWCCRSISDKAGDV